MEIEDFYFKLLPMVRCEEGEREALAVAIAGASARSLNRAAFQLMNLKWLAGVDVGLHAQMKGIVEGELKATLFSQLRLRTSVALTAVMASRCKEGVGLKQATNGMVYDTVCANAASPVYQIFLRAIDYQWEEVLRGASNLGKFGAFAALDVEVERQGEGRVRVRVSGADAPLFAGYILRGFLRGLMTILRVKGEVIVEEDGEEVVLGVRW